ncbi:MAG: helix-turn-helix domain-containing protein [Patulibacter sp.]|nr:helix-turn-helix domain-containing protein [Patulibacter sp.]
MPDAVGTATATLGGLCTDLGADLLEVVLAPHGLDVEVSHVVVHDPLDAPGAGIADGDVVLAIGAPGDSDATAELVRCLGRAGAVAVVLKRRAAMSNAIVAAAHAAAIAVLTTNPDVPWGELNAIVQASLSRDHRRPLPRGSAAATGDLGALADATAAAVGGPVTIEDLHGRLLAFSQDGQEIDAVRAATILGRRVPERWMRELRRAGAFEQLLRTEDVVEVEVEGLRPRRAIAVRSGDTVLGAIWLVAPATGLTPGTNDALREAAPIAALQLLRHRVPDDLERRVRSGMLRTLLRGEGPAEPVVAHLGLPADAKLVVVAVAPPRPPAPDRLLDLVLVHLHAFHWPAAATILDDRVYVLVALPDGRDRDALRRVTGDCLVRAQATLGSELRAGISAPAGGAIAAGRRGADQCLDLGPGNERVVMFEQVHGRALLADVEAFLRSRRATISPELQLLVDHDLEHGSVYLATLRAFLDALSDAGRAATALQIHVNTLRYRVRRILEITGVDLTDPGARLALEVQLLLLDDGLVGFDESRSARSYDGMTRDG